jgi:hypothetical protein
MNALKRLVATASGYKRIFTIVLALLVSVSRHIGLAIDPDILSDVTAVILSVGLGAHAVDAARKPRAVLPVALLLLVGCGQVITEAKTDASLFIRVAAPHEVKSFADGELRCHQKGPMALELKGQPGDCLKADADGRFVPCH